MQHGTCPPQSSDCIAQGIRTHSEQHLCSSKHAFVFDGHLPSPVCCGHQLSFCRTLTSYDCWSHHHHHHHHLTITEHEASCQHVAKPRWLEQAPNEQLAYMRTLGRPVRIFLHIRLWVRWLTALDQTPSAWNLDAWLRSVSHLGSAILRAVVNRLEWQPPFSASKSKFCQRPCTANALAIPLSWLT